MTNETTQAVVDGTNAATTAVSSTVGGNLGAVSLPLILLYGAGAFLLLLVIIMVLSKIFGGQPKRPAKDPAAYMRRDPEPGDKPGDPSDPGEYMRNRAAD